MAKAGQRSGARLISPATMLTVRQWHTYIGAFVAPSVLFFAFTGSLQLFSLHEAHGAYTPPPIVEALSRVHKDQVMREKPAAKGDQPEDEHDHGGGRHHHADAEKGPPAPPPWSVMALKWVFLIVAIGLITSTLLGLWMALTYSRRKALVLALFAAGVVLPVLLVAL